MCLIAIELKSDLELNTANKLNFTPGNLAPLQDTNKYIELAHIQMSQTPVYVPDF